jgi:hypothetical protein
MKAGETATTTLGDVFARAIAAKDHARLRGVLADPIDFRALTPQRYWEATSAEEVVDQIILGEWFDSGDHIQELCSVTTGEVSDRHHVAYRMRVRNADGEFYVEQQAYYRVKGDCIDWLRILCSGYRPVTPPLDSAADSPESQPITSSNAPVQLGDPKTGRGPDV